MRLTTAYWLGLICAASFISGCQRQVEDLKLTTIPDYVPLTAGKYITYQLDSTVFTNFGRNEEVHSYQEKNIVDTQVTDNLNRQGYRIIRYLRDSAGASPWIASGTYFMTAQKKALEVVENNWRTIRLVAPVQQGNTWKGNRFLPTKPYASLYTFNNDDNMGAWDFTIDSTGQTINLNGKTITDVVSVKSIDESINVPLTDAGSYAARSYAADKYAKGIGLVYQELVLWEYQPNPGGSSPYKTGFGVKRTLLDYN